MTMTSSETWKVVIWDKAANDPYYVLRYEDEETARYVAKRMRYHYVEQWHPHGETVYEVKLQRIQGEADG